MIPTKSVPQSKGSLWTGRAISSLVVLFLALDGVMKLIQAQPVLDASTQLGYPLDLTQTLGALALLCAIAYAIPRTALLGAILLTGFLGGATASHLRIGSPLTTHVLFGVYVGILAWLGLYLREPRLRALLPLTSSRA